MEKDFEIIGTSKNGTNGCLKLDITQADEVFSILGEIKPDIVINAAALTDVDECERNSELAFKVNSEGAENVAKACSSMGARIIHISTDYVFDGELGMYAETSPTSPIQEYGESKLLGERGVIRYSENDPTIIRTSGVFDSTGKNFFTWLTDSLSRDGEVSIIDDQIVSPTHVNYVSESIIHLIKSSYSGLWNVASERPISRIEFAKMICVHCDLEQGLVRSISMDDLEWIAKRPRDSSLDCGKLNCTQTGQTVQEMLERYC